MIKTYLVRLMLLPLRGRILTTNWNGWNGESVSSLQIKHSLCYELKRINQYFIQVQLIRDSLSVAKCSVMKYI